MTFREAIAKIKLPVRVDTHHYKEGWFVRDACDSIVCVCDEKGQVHFIAALLNAAPEVLHFLEHCRDNPAWEMEHPNKKHQLAERTLSQLDQAVSDAR